MPAAPAPPLPAPAGTGPLAFAFLFSAFTQTGSPLPYFPGAPGCASKPKSGRGAGQEPGRRCCRVPLHAQAGLTPPDLA